MAFVTLTSLRGLPHRPAWPGRKRTRPTLAPCRASGGDGKAGGDGGLGQWFSGTLAGASKAKELEAKQRDAIRAPPRTESELEMQAWRWWFALPLQPYGSRPTAREEIVPGRVWGFDQPHGGLNIVVNIRMTVVKLEGGGLWVHAPVAPTGECLALLGELEAEHGPVRHVVHPTYAVEHKVFVAAFSRAYPKAEVWVAPGQWSFPLDLPLSWLGFPRSSRVIGEGGAEPPWADEFDWAVLSLEESNFVEVSFCHRPSRTLLVTDVLQCAPSEPPPVLLIDPLPLLLTQRADGQDLVEDTEENRLGGWAKTALLALFIRPDAVEILSGGGFEWKKVEEAFGEVAGQLIVAPILSVLILNRHPVKVAAWAEKISSWSYDTVVPGHLGAAQAGPGDVRAAFDFLGSAGEEAGLGGGARRGAGQLSLLKQIDTFLTDNNLAKPAP